MRTYTEPDSLASKDIVVPLYRRREDFTEHWASGILLTYGNRQFLCTAAHALSDETHSLVVGGASPFFLNSFRRNVPKKHFTLEDDPFDIAVTELNRDQSSNATAGARFLCLDRDTPWSPKGGDRVLLCARGFLNSDNDHMPDATLSANLIEVPLLRDENYLGHDKRLQSYKHYYINGLYNPSAMGGVKKEFRGNRAYEGMSGGALYYGDWSAFGLCIELAGMLVMVKPAKRGAVRFLALRTRAIIEILHRFYSDLPPPLPPHAGFDRRSSLR
jgi:hypothetical protein